MTVSSQYYIVSFQPSDLLSSKEAQGLLGEVGTSAESEERVEEGKNKMQTLWGKGAAVGDRQQCLYPTGIKNKY